MMKKQIVLGVLVLFALLITGCGNPVDSAINAMNAGAAKVEKAIESGDQNAFLAGLQDMANAMDELKPAVQSIPGDKRPENMRKAQDAAKAWTALAMSPKFTEMAEKVKNSPQSLQLTEIMRQMQITMERDGNQF